MKIERYVTKGIQREMSVELQTMLWNLQSQIRQEQVEIDYLQVYELKIIEKNNKRIQGIHHRAELPKHKRTYYYKVKEPVLGKVLVLEERVEQVIIETMMFAEEY